MRQINNLVEELEKHVENRQYFEPDYSTEDLKKQLPETKLILVVDDSEMIRALVKLLLERKGYRVICANNGLEAISIFKKNKDRISLVVLDLKMPVMNGKDCFENLRKIEPDIPCLISSAYISQEMLKEFIKAEHCLILEKPYLPEELISVVNEMIF